MNAIRIGGPVFGLKEDLTAYIQYHKDHGWAAAYCPMINDKAKAEQWKKGFQEADMWYTIDGNPAKHFITDIGTVDPQLWAGFANNTLHTIRFYANDTPGFETWAEISILKAIFLQTPDITPIPAPSTTGFIQYLEPGIRMQRTT